MVLKSKLSALCFLVLCSIVGFSGNIWADNDDQISNLEEQISDNEDKYEEIQNQLDELEQSKDDLESYMSQLSETHATMESAIADLDSRIEQQNAEIAAAEKEIEELDVELSQQYEEMKLRIQYIYESDTFSYTDVFLSSESIAEILERVEYIQSMLEYDRNQMAEYESNIESAEALKSQLEKEQEQLLLLKEEQNRQIADLGEMMVKAEENIAANQSQIEEALAVAEQIEEEIEAQKNSVEELKKEEARRKQEASNGTNTGDKIPYQQLDGDIKRMAAIIWCEARGESYEGQLAVGTVVMNRVESPRFPNTIEGVISQKGQFSPYKSGKYAIALAMENMQQSCIDAAVEVIENGVRTGDWLFFRMKNGIIQGTIIGCHVFY